MSPNRSLRLERLNTRELMVADVAEAVDAADELNELQNENAMVSAPMLDNVQQTAQSNGLQQTSFSIPLVTVLGEEELEGGDDEVGVTDLIDIIFEELDEDGDGETDSTGLLIDASDEFAEALSELDPAATVGSLFPHLSIPVNGVLGYEDAELMVHYRLPGSTTVHELDINFVTGKEFVDAIEGLHEKGAIVTHISILGHGGDNARTRGTTITLNDGELSVGVVSTYDKDSNTITHLQDRIRIKADGVTHDLTEEFQGFVDRNPSLEITLRACYGGENDDKLGKQVHDSLDCTVHAYTDKLKYVPLWNVTLGWFSPGKWNTYD